MFEPFWAMWQGREAGVVGVLFAINKDSEHPDFRKLITSAVITFTDEEQRQLIGSVPAGQVEWVRDMTNEEKIYFKSLLASQEEKYSDTKH